MGLDTYHHRVQALEAGQRVQLLPPAAEDEAPLGHSTAWPPHGWWPYYIHLYWLLLLLLLLRPSLPPAAAAIAADTAASRERGCCWG